MARPVTSPDASHLAFLSICQIASNCENVALTGDGTLEAEMSTWNKWMSRPAPHLEALKKLYTISSTHVPVEQRPMAEGENHLRPQFIQFNRCENVLTENVTLDQRHLGELLPRVSEERIRA